jgi:hypothetical protein
MLILGRLTNCSMPSAEKLRRRDPSERASAEIFTPVSSEAEIARSLKSSDQRRRSPTGEPSSRAARTSMNWFGLVLRIGIDIDVAIHVQPLSPDRLAPPEWRRLCAYDVVSWFLAPQENPTLLFTERRICGNLAARSEKSVSE